MKRILFFFTFFFILSFPNLFCDVSQDTEERFSSPFKVEEEYYLGKAVAVNLVSKYGLIDDKKMIEYVSAVGNTLALGSDQPSTYHGYTFGILNSDKELAYACPDGFIFISIGLIKKLKSEDELASIIACEISHIVYNDPIFSLNPETTMKYSNLLKSSLNESSNFSQEISKIFEDITNEILMILDKGYNQEKTLRADKITFFILINTNYSPKAFASAIENLNINDQYIKTHPDTQKRITSMNDLVSQSGAGIEINNNRTKRFKNTFKIK